MSFLDNVKRYNENKGNVVPVNPPEAVKVLETKSAPEVAGVPEPAALPSAAPSGLPAPSAASSAASEQLTRGQKAAATRAANKAAVAPSVTETPLPTEAASSAAPTSLGEGAELDYLLTLVRRRLPAGVSVTITGAFGNN